MKLHGIPEAISGGICPFPSVEAACNATIRDHPVGIPVARIELLDEAAGEGVQRLFEADACPRRRCCFLEFHGTAAGVAEQSERFGEIAEDLGGGPFEWTTNAEERTKLWQARHDAYWSVLELAPRRDGRSRPTCACRFRGSPNASTETQTDIASTA